MKKTIPILLLFALLVFTLPFSAILFSHTVPGGSSSIGTLPPTNGQTTPQEAQQTVPGGETSQGTEGEAGTPQQAEPAEIDTDFKIYNESTGAVDTVSMRDYVIGSVAAEMPMAYTDEALKAQAVASLTYALALKANSLGGDPNMGGAHFAANPSQREGYMTDEAMQSFWGDAYAENKARIESLVDSLENKILVYDNKPIHACYHAISAGKTQASESVWGEALPYLVSVDSSFDITSPDFNSTLSFSIADMQALLQAALIPADGEPQNWFGAAIMAPTGYVESISVGGIPYTGTQIREALGLRSSAFTVAFTSDLVFNVTTQGYGHGVGLSQYGANSMALAGMTHEEILMHYFTGASFGFV